MSAQILNQRADYYHILESTQKGFSSLTDWLVWFLTTLSQALEQDLVRSDRIVAKAQFWYEHQNSQLNECQVRMLNKLWTDFYGKLTTKKWATITKTSPDTALRDINDLIDKGILKKSQASERSQNYELVVSEK